MANSNGTMRMLRIVGLSVTIILAFTGYIVANDQNSRKRDDGIKEDLSTHKIESEKAFYEYALEQKTVNTKILITLESIGKDIEYIKQSS